MSWIETVLGWLGLSDEGSEARAEIDPDG